MSTPSTPPSVRTDLPRPNVIWILSDQHRYHAMGHTGDPNVYTPNLDRMATEGLSFTRCVSGSPLCTPFRGALITGQYPNKVSPALESRLPDGQLSVAHAFNEAGYHTAYFGKWHLDGFNEKESGRSTFHVIPPERRFGFQTWCAYENNNSNWDCTVHGGDASDGTDFQEQLDGYETDALTNRLTEFLDSRNEESEPFFAVLSVQPPHMPFVAPEQFMRRYTPGKIQLRPNVPTVRSVREKAQVDLAGYYAMIENLDWNIGRLRERLRQLGLHHNTHLVYFSDHGDLHGSHGQHAKGSPYEESIRIPMIIGGHIPRYQNKAGKVDVPMNHVDIAPTTLGLCGIDKPDWMPGRDYSGFRIFGRDVPEEADSVYLQMCVPLAGGSQPDRPWRGVVTRDGWKYAALEHQPWMLFNLNEDPFEEVNLALASRYSVQRKRLNDRLAEWIRETDDSFRLPDL